MTTTADQILKIAEEVLGTPHGKPSSAAADPSFANDLGADSLDIVEITMMTEEQFSVQIDDADLVDLDTVGDLAKIVDRMIAEKAAA